MKCLTVCEPFASALVFGPKRVENRPMPTSFRGWVLIHAGKSDKYMDRYPEVRRLWPACPGLEELHRRKTLILGAVKLVDCVTGGAALLKLPPEDVAWAGGPWCWIMGARVAFPEPVPWRGFQGLYDVDVCKLPESAIEVIGGLG